MKSLLPENAAKEIFIMQNAENIAAEAGENRISVVSILVFNRESAERVNSVLSSYGE